MTHRPLAEFEYGITVFTVPVLFNSDIVLSQTLAQMGYGFIKRHVNFWRVFDSMGVAHYNLAHVLKLQL